MSMYEFDHGERVVITWRWQDIAALCPDWDQERCENELNKARKLLVDRSVKLGCKVLEQLLKSEAA